MNALLPADAMEQLAQAAAWRLLAHLFTRPRDGFAPEAEALAREVRDPVLREGAELARGAEEGPYHALLGPGGRASAREVAYRGFLDPGRLLSELAGLYEAFGFAPRSEEPDDHLSVEADFVAYLLVKEIHARAGGRDDAAEITRDARNCFLAEHVAILAKGFAAKLEGGPRYLELAARALARRVEGIPIAEPTSRPPETDPLECGCPLVQE